MGFNLKDNKTDPAQISAEFETLKNDVSGLMRRFSDPVPTQIITKNYDAKIGDQRIAHISDNPHSITPLSAYDARNRRFLWINAGAGELTIAGEFLGARNDAAGTMTNPVLRKGEAIEFFSYFVPNAGTDAAPDDLQIDGARAITKGKYKYQIVNFYRSRYSNDYIDAISNRVANLENKKDFTISKPVSLPALSANTPLDVKVSFPSPMPNTDYSVTAIPFNISALLLGKISVVNAEQIKTVNDVTVRIRSSVSISLTTESITLLVVARSN